MSAFYIRKLKTYFAATDTDKDGVLTVNDFHVMAKRYAKLTKQDDAHAAKTREVATTVWNEFIKGSDSTDGKSLTQDQLVASILKRRSDPKFIESLRQMLTLEFHEVDVNKDGLIQLDEYAVMFQYRGLDPKGAAASFAAIDSNNDGVISLDEFLWAVVDFFTAEDENSPSRLFWGPLV